MVTRFTACELENKKPRKYSEKCLNLLNISRFNASFIYYTVFTINHLEINHIVFNFDPNQRGIKTCYTNGHLFVCCLLEMISIIIITLDRVDHFIPQLEGVKRYTGLSHFIV